MDSLAVSIFSLGRNVSLLHVFVLFDVRFWGTSSASECTAVYGMMRTTCLVAEEGLERSWGLVA